MSAERQIAEKYARALFDLAKEEGRLDAVREDLQVLSELFGAGDGQALMQHPLLSREQKQAAVLEMVEGRIDPLTVSLLKLLVEKRRGALVGAIAHAFEEEVRGLEGVREATVSSPSPLSKPQLDALRRALSAMAGMEVNLTEELDPALRGGARIRMGDLVLDGSLSTRLAQLRRALRGGTGREN